VLITLVTPLHRPSSANIAASVCSIGNKKEHCRHRPAASDGGPGSPIPSVWGLVGDHVPLRIARLRFDRCTTAPETWLLPAVLHAHPLVSSTDCPSASNGGGRRFPSPPSRGPSAIALPRSRSLCSLRRFGSAPPTMSINRSGPHISQEQRRRPAGDRIPLRVSAGDPTPITPVKGTYSGEIESQSRPGNCDSRHRNAISREHMN